MESNEDKIVYLRDYRRPCAAGASAVDPVLTTLRAICRREYWNHIDNTDYKIGLDRKALANIVRVGIQLDEVESTLRAHVLAHRIEYPDDVGLRYFPPLRRWLDEYRLRSEKRK